MSGCMGSLSRRDYGYGKAPRRCKRHLQEDWKILCWFIIVAIVPSSQTVFQTKGRIFTSNLIQLRWWEYHKNKCYDLRWHLNEPWTFESNFWFVVIKHQSIFTEAAKLVCNYMATHTHTHFIWQLVRCLTFTVCPSPFRQLTSAVFSLRLATAMRVSDQSRCWLKAHNHTVNVAVHLGVTMTMMHQYIIGLSKDWMTASRLWLASSFS